MAEADETVRVQFELPELLRRRFKAAAARRGTTMQAVVADAIIAYCAAAETGPATVPARERGSDGR